MNKANFVSFIAEKNDCTKVEAENIINTFTSAVIEAIAEGQEVSLVGFGNFSVSPVEARDGRNPRTGAKIKIAAYNQPKFKVGQKLKDCCNEKR